MTPRLPLLILLAFGLGLLPPARADFPTPTNNQEITNIPLTPPEKTISMMHLPPGFKATLFAAEPDVQQPIAMCWDEKGRLWVAENYTYSDAKERFDMKLKDRILIFEDTDNDGHFDKRTVFYDDLQMLTSIERGFGGVYALCPPHLLFIPTKDDKPTGPPQVLLDGFSTTAASRHTFANGLKWGPDGWLYGRIGISSTSWIDVPGTPEEKRKPTAGGIWRYHPTRKIYEPYCHGTTNPWGMDWDEHGELFFINTVIGHLWHGIQGAHFKRMHGEDPYDHIYGLIDQHADHYHWDKEGGEVWSDTKKAGPSETTSKLGGGHVHIGMMIYQGTNWPQEYRGKIFTCNEHGHRINCDRLEREGSGYVGKHEPDFMKSDDPWLRAVEIQYGPDGGVYVLDWCDIGECHESDGVHRTSGRIYKITYGDPVKPKETDLAKLTDEELVKLQLSDNEWLVRMARWELRERIFQQNNPRRAHAVVQQLLNGKTTSDAHFLNLIWTDLALGTWDSDVFDIDTMSVRSDSVKKAALHLTSDNLRLATLSMAPSGDGKGPRGLPAEFQEMSQRSPELRLGLASLLAENPGWHSVLAPVLLSHGEDAADHNLPLMYWSGIRDLPPAELARLFTGCKIPLVRQYIARRITEDIDKDPAPINELLKLAASNAAAEFTSDILQGMTDALKGWRKANKPAAWDAFVSVVTSSPTGSGGQSKTSPSEPGGLQVVLRDLNVLFGSGRALDEVRAIALDDKADVEARRAALNTLIEAKSPDARKVCEKLLTERGLSLSAAQGLANFDDPAIAETIIKRWRNFYPNEHSAVVAALASRPSFAKVLLDHLENGEGILPAGKKKKEKAQDPATAMIQRSDISPLIARQIRSFNDPALTKQLAEAWGEVHESSDDKKKLIASLKAKLTPKFIARGNPGQGRVLFAGICAACHKLYGEGNTIGPDLTGSGRHDVNYLIENIADPSAVVAADFTMSVITLKDGRVLNGIISAKTERTITVKMVGLETTVDRGDITKQEQLPVSMMPEGQLTALNDEQLSNLISYLMSNGQVSLPQTAAAK